MKPILCMTCGRAHEPPECPRPTSPEPLYLPTGDEMEFTFHGGPNHGKTLTIGVFPGLCELTIGLHRYVVRQHDQILLYAPEQ